VPSSCDRNLGGVVSGSRVRDTATVSEPEPRPIVVGVDQSAASDAALAWACDEARLRGAPVVALHVVVVPYELPRVPIDAPESAPARAGKQILDEAIDRAPTEGVSIEPRLLEGSPAEILVEAAHEGVLLVIGTRPHGRLTSFIVGSVSSAVVHHAPCPVVVVRA
jgi:nucleotide-binding universal stress UspA family protein